LCGNLFTSAKIINYKTSITPPLFIEVPVPSQESEWSCTGVLRVLSVLHLRWWKWSDNV